MYSDDNGSCSGSCRLVDGTKWSGGMRRVVIYFNQFIKLCSIFSAVVNSSNALGKILL